MPSWCASAQPQIGGGGVTMPRPAWGVRSKRCQALPCLAAWWSWQLARASLLVIHAAQPVIITRPCRLGCRIRELLARGLSLRASAARLPADAHGPRSDPGMLLAAAGISDQCCLRRVADQCCLRCARLGGACGCGCCTHKGLQQHLKLHYACPASPAAPKLNTHHALPAAGPPRHAVPAASGGRPVPASRAAPAVGAPRAAHAQRPGRRQPARLLPPGALRSRLHGLACRHAPRKLQHLGACCTPPASERWGPYCRWLAPCWETAPTAAREGGEPHPAVSLQVTGNLTMCVSMAFEDFIWDLGSQQQRLATREEAGQVRRELLQLFDHDMRALVYTHRVSHWRGEVGAHA